MNRRPMSRNSVARTRRSRRRMPAPAISDPTIPGPTIPGPTIPGPHGPRIHGPATHDRTTRATATDGSADLRTNRPMSVRPGRWRYSVRPASTRFRYSNSHLQIHRTHRQSRTNGRRRLARSCQPRLRTIRSPCAQQHAPDLRSRGSARLSDERAWKTGCRIRGIRSPSFDQRPARPPAASCC